MTIKTMEKIITPEDRIRDEIVRLNRLFSQLVQSKKDLAQGLIESAAFLRVTLTDLAKDLLSNGFITSYQQSPKSPIYKRLRPEAKLYNSTTRNYLNIISKLKTLLKDCQETDNCIDELEAFNNEI